MYPNILSAQQIQLLPLIKSFAKEYYLVGGTAIALQIGHRESIDFDLFKLSNVQKEKVKAKVSEFGFDYRLLFADSQSIHIISNEVKLTFFQYPFKIKTSKAFENIKMPDLLTLAAMKAYALGRRAKWKDYVDLYFILSKYHTIDEISACAKEVFQENFSPKLFKQQLCYFEDIDYSEEVSYVIEPVDEQKIKNYLIHIATT